MPHRWRSGDKIERREGERLRVGRSDGSTDLDGREGTVMLGTTMETE